MLDEVDLKILNLLQNDAKLTAKTLSDRIALSQTPVYERIKKLEKSGVIKKYVALLEPELLGKNLVIFMNIATADHTEATRRELVEELNEYPEVSELYFTSGQFDFVAKVRVSSVADYRDFLVNKITNNPNIKSIVSQVVLEEMKYSTSIL